MGDVVDLAPPRYDGRTCPVCGGAWFLVQAITLDLDGSATGYAAPVTCATCGHVLKPGPWAAPHLEALPDPAPSKETPTA